MLGASIAGAASGAEVGDFVANVAAGRRDSGIQRREIEERAGDSRRAPGEDPLSRRG